MTSGPITLWQIDGEEVEAVAVFYFLGLQNHCGWCLQPPNEKMLAPWKKRCGRPRQCITKQRQYFADKIHVVKAIVFFPIYSFDILVIIGFM